MNGEDVPDLFQITIDGMEHIEWQGSIQFADHTAARFESLPGLLRLIQDKLDVPLPAWEQAEENHDKGEPR